MNVHRWFFCLFCFMKFFVMMDIEAHEPLASWTAARISSEALILEVVLTPGEARLLVRDRVENAPYIYPDNFDEVKPLFVKYAIFDLFDVTVDGNVITLERADVVYDADKDDVIFWLYYPKPYGKRLDFRARYLDLMPEAHEATLQVYGEEGQSLGWELLIKGNDGYAVSFKAPIPVTMWDSFKRFLKLGIAHILTGYDHLLFLGGLIIACRYFREMAVVISCFTLAHSLTLGIAAFDWFLLPGDIVEPLIAITIIYVGIENLLREPKKRWLVTFVFGLIHGFGFASVLRETGLGTDGWDLIVPLFSFNLGVEMGQVLVAMLCLPLILGLRKWSHFIRYGLPALSIGLALMGGYWFVVRVFFL
jgi:hydrogenase/urease accessory protein HupE